MKLTNLETSLPPEGDLLTVDIDHLMTGVLIANPPYHRILLQLVVPRLLQTLQRLNLLGASVPPLTCGARRGAVVCPAGSVIGVAGDGTKDMVGGHGRGAAGVRAGTLVVARKARICGWGLKFDVLDLQRGEYKIRWLNHILLMLHVYQELT